MNAPEQVLQRHQLRVTQARKEVIDVFLKRGRAISHQDVESALPGADRVTLYRTLSSFEDAGIIHQVIDGDNVRKYALCGGNCDSEHHSDNHVHFQCLNCGKTVCLEDIHFPQLTLPAGYKSQNQEVLVQGLCPEC